MLRFREIFTLIGDKIPEKVDDLAQQRINLVIAKDLGKAVHDLVSSALQQAGITVAPWRNPL